MSGLCARVLSTLSLVALVASLGAGCGEVEALVFPERPDNGEAFVAAQDALIAVGCSLNGGCHTNIIGNFKVTPNPKGGAALDEEFQITKPFIDLEDPAASDLPGVATVGDPRAQTHIKCFAGPDDCAAQVVVGWLQYTSNAQLPTPANLGCEVVVNGCGTVN